MLNRVIADLIWRTRGVGPSARRKRENRKSFDVVTSRHKPEPHEFITDFRLSGISGPPLAATALSTGACLTRQRITGGVSYPRRKPLESDYQFDSPSA